MTVSCHTDIAAATTFLFVPGDRPERFALALDSGADCVIVDLEDAVADADKQSALEHATDLVRQTVSTTALMVRINDPRGDRGRRDVDALAALGDSALCAVMVPKAETGSTLEVLGARLPGGVGLIPLIESVTGLHEVAELAATPGVLRLALGPLDLCAQLGLDPDDATRLAPARFALVSASAAAGLPAPVDGPCTDVHDLSRVRAAAVESLRSGFTAKLCIHPAQIAGTAAAMSPSAEELHWARTILESFTGGVAVIEGRMVDQPVLLRARGILARGVPPIPRTVAPSSSPEEP